MLKPSLQLDDVWIEYAIYGAANRSLRKTVAHLVSGGRLGGESANLSRVQALQGVSLSIRDGERVGLIGGNGAGKTTMLRVMAGAMRPARGRMRRVGTTASLFDVGLGMNAEATGWDNIILRGLFLGLKPAQVRARMDDIAEFSGLTEAQLGRPIRTYSSGMTLRLAFAVCTSIQPDILLMDEWISVGDANFLEKAQNRMASMVENARVLVIASHADHLIRQICNRAVLLDGGHLIADGPVDQILAAYHLRQQLAG